MRRPPRRTTPTPYFSISSSCDEVEEVRLAAGGVARAVLELELLLGRLVRLGAGDVAVLGHLLQHLVAPLQRRRGVAEGVVLRRRLRQAGEQRGLVEVEVLDVLVEERHRRRLDAERGAPADGAVRDVVEVLVQDPALGVLVLELLGELRLADLARVVALGVLDVERAHQLLGDRRAALHRVAGLEVAHAGADDRVEVDARVLVEALVLDRDGRLADHRRHLTEGHDLADDVRLHVAQARAVGGEDHRRLALLVRLERLQVRRCRRDREHVADRREGADDRHERQDADAEQELAARPAAVPASPLLSLPVGHGETGGRRPCAVTMPRPRIDRARGAPAASADAARSPPCRARAGS